jgi:predicted nucleic acid-binding protein
VIVADANLLAYLVMPGQRTDEAEAVLTADSVWVAPVLWRSELMSVLQQYVRRTDLTVAHAVAAVQRAEAVIAGREGAVDPQVVFELANRSKCSTYDCEYVALATGLGVQLVTADREVLRAFPKVAIEPRRFLDAMV